VCVFVKVGAVEEPKSMFVGWKVSRDPVNNYTQPGIMTGVHECHEIIRGSISAAGCKKARYLITPRAIKRMLGDRQQLDVGEAHILHIGDEIRYEIPIRQPLPTLSLPPGTDM